MTNVGIITQARMTSTRLPGKVLIEAGGKTMLAHQIYRLRRTGYPLIVATTTNSSDDPIVQTASDLDVEVYRGSEHDVLSRFAEAARHFDFETIVRVTSDCPLIDDELVKRGIDLYLELRDEHVLVSNTVQRTYPRGFDFEVFSAARLFEAERIAQEDHQREHVTPWLYDSESTQLHQIIRESDASHYRITLDTVEDLQLLSILLNSFDNQIPTGEDVVAFLTENPDLAEINSGVEQKVTTHGNLSR